MLGFNKKKERSICVLQIGRSNAQVCFPLRQKSLHCFHFLTPFQDGRNMIKNDISCYIITESICKNCRFMRVKRIFCWIKKKA